MEYDERESEFDIEDEDKDPEPQKSKSLKETLFSQKSSYSLLWKRVRTAKMGLRILPGKTSF